MNEITTGHTKEEYFAISTKKNLPPRCPLLRKCCRAVYSRYYLGFKLGGSDLSFNEFLKSENQTWNPEEMIQEIEQLSYGSSADVIYTIDNCCPEIPLFETQYLPNYFRRYAFGSASYIKESRSFEAVAKHFSECAEFSEYLFGATTTDLKNPSKKSGRKRSPISRALRFEIYQRENFTCFYCKTHKDELPTGVSLTLDHKVPYSDGGDDSPSNLVTACSDCNSGKSNKIVNDI